jgi:hypothetical protein
MNAKEYYNSTRLVETRNWTLEMVFNFAEEYAENINKNNAKELFRYHTMSARATLYPNKTIEEVSAIIEETINNWKD